MQHSPAQTTPTNAANDALQKELLRSSAKAATARLEAIKTEVLIKDLSFISIEIDEDIYQETQADGLECIDCYYSSANGCAGSAKACPVVEHASNSLESIISRGVYFDQFVSQHETQDHIFPVIAAHAKYNDRLMQDLKKALAPEFYINAMEFMEGGKRVTSSN